MPTFNRDLTLVGSSSYVDLVTKLAGEWIALDLIKTANSFLAQTVTADALINSSPGLFGGLVCIVAGNTPTLYNNTSAAGQILSPGGVAMTAGQTLLMDGKSIEAANGLYADWTTGTWLVLYR